MGPALASAVARPTTSKPWAGWFLPWSLIAASAVSEKFERLEGKLASEPNDPK